LTPLSPASNATFGPAYLLRDLDAAPDLRRIPLITEPDDLRSVAVVMGDHTVFLPGVPTFRPQTCGHRWPPVEVLVAQGFTSLVPGGVVVDEAVPVVAVPVVQEERLLVTLPGLCPGGTGAGLVS
jgi:hypothetical protein